MNVDAATLMSPTDAIHLVCQNQSFSIWILTYAYIAVAGLIAHFGRRKLPAPVLVVLHFMTGQLIAAMLVAFNRDRQSDDVATNEIDTTNNTPHDG